MTAAARPKVGDTVLIKGVVTAHHGGDFVWVYVPGSGQSWRVELADITHIGKHPPAEHPKEGAFDEGLWWWSFQRRKPWEVLTSAANLLDQHGHKDARKAAVALADRLHGAANPPAPVTVLKEVMQCGYRHHIPFDLRDRINATIAAHDAKAGKP